MVVSGCCVSAHDMAATWAMNSLGAPALWLSLMSSAGTLPFFLFTLPAGAMADLADRRRLLRISNCWLAGSAGLLATCSFLGGLTPEIILAGVFLLGTGFAFQAPVASASIPEIVGKEQLAFGNCTRWSSDELGRHHRSGTWWLACPVGWRKHRLCRERAGVHSRLFAVMTWKRKREILDTPLEGFFDSLSAAIRYMRYAPGVRIVLLRNFIFGVLIGATPALLPVVGLKGLHLGPLDLGFVFTCMGLGSLGRCHFRPRAGQEEVQTESDDHAERSCSSRELCVNGNCAPATGFLCCFRGGRSRLDSLCLGTLGGRSASHTRLDPRPDECHTHDGVAGGHVVSRPHVGRDCDRAKFGVGFVLG